MVRRVWASTVAQAVSAASVAASVAKRIMCYLPIDFRLFALPRCVRESCGSAAAPLHKQSPSVVHSSPGRSQGLSIRSPCSRGISYQTSDAYVYSAFRWRRYPPALNVLRTQVRLWVDSGCWLNLATTEFEDRFRANSGDRIESYHYRGEFCFRPIAALRLV